MISIGLKLTLWKSTVLIHLSGFHYGVKWNGLNPNNESKNGVLTLLCTPCSRIVGKPFGGFSSFSFVLYCLKQSHSSDWLHCLKAGPTNPPISMWQLSKTKMVKHLGFPTKRFFFWGGGGSSFILKSCPDSQTPPRPTTYTEYLWLNVNTI